MDQIFIDPLVRNQIVQKSLGILSLFILGIREYFREKVVLTFVKFPDLRTVFICLCNCNLI